MYALKFRNYAGGCFDLGGGDHPCTTCRWFAGFDPDQLPNNFQETVTGYQCSRFVTIDGNVFMECADARRDEEVCGLDGAAWESAVESRRRASELYIDAAVSGAHCDECRHQLPWSFHAAGQGTGSAIDVILCARYTLPVSGAPMPCTDARGDSSICGSAGNGFEVPAAPERPLPTLDAGEMRFYAPPVVKIGTDSVAGSGGCWDCKFAALAVNDPANPLDDVLTCTRYVDSVTAEPLPCDVARSYSGICGVDGLGFEPRETESD